MGRVRSGFRTGGSGTYAPLIWQPNTAYAQGAAVYYQGIIYVAKATFTSGSSFSATNWDTLPPASSAATILELMGTNFLSNVTATTSWTQFVAPFACKITSASLVTQSAIAASDTNYWTVDLRRRNAAANDTIVSKTSQATGGQAFASYVDWNFDAAVWSTTNQVFAKGDILDIRFGLVGAPGSLLNTTLTFRYVPV